MTKAGKKPCAKYRKKLQPPKDMEEWQQRMLQGGSSFGTVGLTHLLVRSANEIYCFEQSLEVGDVPWIKSSEPDAGWEDLYLRPHKMFQRLIDHTFPFPDINGSASGSTLENGSKRGLGTLLREMAILARHLKRRGDAEFRQDLEEFFGTPEGQQAAVDIFKGYQQLRHANIDELLGLGEEMNDEMFYTGIATRPVQFFLLVWIPCLICYGESPKVLFRQARQGNIDAFEKLAQVDKRLMWCPSMAKLFDEASRNRHNGRYEILMKALLGTANSLGIGRYKCAISAYILRMDEMMRAIHPRWRRLTSIDIRGAFDAAARERGFLVDEDLPVSRDGYRKAIQRHRDFAHSKVWDMFTV